MRVLVTESHSQAADRVVDELTASGHEVLRCHAGSGPAFPCVGLAGEPCPVEVGVDVAVTVRAHPQSTPAPTEDGAVCALRTHVPLVVLGQTLLHPFGAFDAVAAEGQADAVATVEAAATARRPEHEAVAESVLRETLTRAEQSADSAQARVTRTRDGLDVTLLVAPETSAAARARAAVRVVGALREFDADAPQVNLSVGELPEEA